MFDHLVSLRAKAADRHMLDLFEADPDRASDFSASTGDMRLDYSKTLIDAEIREALIALELVAEGSGDRVALVEAIAEARAAWQSAPEPSLV